MWSGLKVLFVWNQISIVHGLVNEIHLVKCGSCSSGKAADSGSAVSWKEADLSDCAEFVGACGSESGALEKLQCLQGQLPQGGLCEVILTESWNITHYCIATDAEIGGWAFRTPISVAIHPQDVKNASFSATLVPTTGDNDIIQTHSVDASLLFLPDPLPMDANHSLVRQCKLKSPKFGTPGLIKVVYDAEDTERSRQVKEHVPAEAEVPSSSPSKPIILQIDQYVNNGQDSDVVLKPENAVIEIITNAPIISNNGVLVPALDYPRFSLSYSANITATNVTATANISGFPPTSSAPPLSD